jgi:hypothetical protein
MPRPHGHVRQSQVLRGSGPGAMVDLPNHAVVIGGLDFWQGAGKQIFEPRLTTKLSQLLNVPDLKLFAPPPAPSDPAAPQTGIAAFRFPEWFTAQFEARGANGMRSRPLVHQKALVNGKYQREHQKYPVVPVRFVQACRNGHISDVEWYFFVHGAQDKCRRPLWLDEKGTSGDLSDITVRCECGKARSLAQAARPNTLGTCRGQRPWLGAAAFEQCGGQDGSPEKNHLLIRSASNAYFAEIMSVISLPDHDAALRAAVELVWEDFLQYVDNADDLRRERKKAKVAAALDGQIEDAILADIKRRKAGVAPRWKPIKQDELDMLMKSAETLGEDAPEGDFYARALPLPAKRSAIMEPIERIVLVHRLREVIAQVGFTRFQAAVPDIDGELDIDVRRAPLAREVTWLPAVENRGEGVFVALKTAAVTAWLKRPEVQQRAQDLKRGFDSWKARNSGDVEFPDLRYIMLHSLSHLLITAVSLECGYSASSIRERVYVGPAGCGILLHTGSTDAEGTLGGLVQVGRRFEHHLQQALALGQLCSNDPVCAQHDPRNVHEERFLLGAACHGCLLIAETSCERRNEFLDRALVVGTVDGHGAEFFQAV